MEQNKEPQKSNKIREGEASGNNTDGKSTDKHADDAFKTSDREHRLGWEHPMDEQQHDEGTTDNKED